MIAIILQTLEELALAHKDEREHIFQVKIESFEGNTLVLNGRVLERSNLDEIRTALSAAAPGIVVQDEAVEVLRRGEPRLMHVSTNLSSLHRQTSFLSESLTQMLFGFQVEVLEEQERWGFVRCSDGYLGWTYLPYLSSEPIFPATHLVCAPVAALHSNPQTDAQLVSRVLGGTFVHLKAIQGDWAQIDAHVRGWLPVSALRDLQSLPRTAAKRRAQMIADAYNMLGVYYQWGGSSANGIDCSGLAQLVHRLSGITLRRDADQQMWDGIAVEPENMQPGDLVFFGDGINKPPIEHVGVSLGGWRIIHSSRSRNGVYVDDIQQVPHLRDSVAGACTYLVE